MTNAEVRLLQAVNRSGVDEPVSVTMAISSGSATISVTVGDEPPTLVTGEYLFFCLLDLRRRLEARGLLLCCQGARLDVWPSGLLLDWTGGRTAYVLVQPPDGERFAEVDVLDPASPDEVVTVEEQERFMREFHGLPARSAGPT